jgi:hypothetical protein
LNASFAFTIAHIEIIELCVRFAVRTDWPCYDAFYQVSNCNNFTGIDRLTFKLKLLFWC